MFPEDKLSVIYLDLQIQKVIIPWLLMHRDSYEIENWVKVLQFECQVSEMMWQVNILCVSRWKKR